MGFRVFWRFRTEFWKLIHIWGIGSRIKGADNVAQMVDLARAFKSHYPKEWVELLDYWRNLSGRRLTGVDVMKAMNAGLVDESDARILLMGIPFKDFKIGDRVVFNRDHKLAKQIGRVVTVDEENDFITVRYDTLWQILTRRSGTLAFSRDWARSNLQRVATPGQHETKKAQQ